MPFKIGRHPRGLTNALTLFGGVGPEELEDRARAVVDLLQFYGMQQQAVLTQNAGALAEGSFVAVSSSTTFALLYAATGTVIKTATATALRMSITGVRNGSNGCQHASSDLGPFGATETGPAEECFC